MKFMGKEIKCPKCGCKGILRQNIYGECLECEYKFNLYKYKEEKS
jgi:hypothetical protein